MSIQAKQNKIGILILGITFMGCIVIQNNLMANQLDQGDNSNNKAITQTTIARVEFEIGEILLDDPLNTAQLDAIKIMLNSISNLPDQEKLEQLNYIKEKIKNFKLKQEVKQEVKNELTAKKEEGNKKPVDLIYKQGKALIKGYNVNSFPCELSALPASPIFEQVVNDICVKTQKFRYPSNQENFLEDKYLLKYTFYFKANVSGFYSFVVNDINTSMIYLDNELVLPYVTGDWQGVDCTRVSKRSFNVELNNGFHYFEIYHSRKNERFFNSDYSFEIFYKAPNISDPKKLSGEDIYLAYQKK